MLLVTILALAFPIFILPCILSTENAVKVESEKQLSAQEEEKQQQQQQQQQQHGQRKVEQQEQKESTTLHKKISAIVDADKLSNTTTSNSKRSNEKDSERNDSSSSNTKTTTPAAPQDLDKKDSIKHTISKSTISNWRCACAEGGGFLPPGLLQETFGGAVAALRMSTGECYHGK
jgi:type II secretory pathway pseudopilin PulG